MQVNRLAQCESRIESLKTSIRTTQTSLSKALLDGANAKAELEKAVKDHQAAHHELQTKLKESKATAAQTTKDLKEEKERTAALQARVGELTTSKVSVGFSAPCTAPPPDFLREAALKHLLLFQVT